MLHRDLAEIPDRILWNAEGAIAQANTHAVFFDPGREYWSNMSVLNAAHAGELLLKALIAKSHPLLLFKNVAELYDGKADQLLIRRLLEKGKTHDFQHLPNILWATTGISLPDRESFEKIRKLRNSIQHFYHPDGMDDYGEVAAQVSLEFLYKNVDPLLHKHFGEYAIEYHEDLGVSYDYVVAALLRRQIRFTVPESFAITEVSLSEELTDSSDAYRSWFIEELKRVDRMDLLDQA